MKKQILVLATTFITVAFFSCRKESIETPQTGNSMESIQAINSQKPAGPSTVNLNKGLAGWYRFDGNLIESTGKLPDVALNYLGADMYTEDRNGVANRAIKFTGRYLGYVNNVPHSPKMSVAFWARYDDASAPPSNFVCSQSDGPRFMQVSDQYYGYNSPFGMPNIPSGPIDGHWHHLVVTIDGTFCKFYVDGSLVNSVVSPDIEPETIAYYYVGLGNVIEKCWRGAVDDLRFYSRTLSATEVQSLYNL
jgi:hypothetical protein